MSQSDYISRVRANQYKGSSSSTSIQAYRDKQTEARNQDSNEGSGLSETRTNKHYTRKVYSSVQRPDDMPLWIEFPSDS